MDADAVDSKPNPCVGCGACCAYFRVAFYWREAEEKDSNHPVPPGSFVDLDSQWRCMRGTEVKHNPKCVGLKGRVGRDASCSIHAQRPSPCRDFTASFSNGRRNPRCDEARRAKGLRPLGPGDWVGVDGDVSPSGATFLLQAAKILPPEESL